MSSNEDKTSKTGEPDDQSRDVSPVESSSDSKNAAETNAGQSAYPRDDYLRNTVSCTGKNSPAEVNPPETGFRWQEPDERKSSEEQTESDDN